MDTEKARVLVVDDNEDNRDLLSRHLRPYEIDVEEAADGRQALDTMCSMAIDLVFLDILMPEMDGYQVLEVMKQDEGLRHIPVVVISAINDLDSVVRCVKLGAVDYLFKPFNKVLLRARLEACLEKKRLRDSERALLRELATERDKTDRLLLSILPKNIAARLKSGETTIADSFDEATVLFADVDGFATLAGSLSPQEQVSLLNDLFSRFDALAGSFGLEKIKTIGDAYMAAAGIPEPRADHAEAAASMALEMQRASAQCRAVSEAGLSLRIGINSGPVVAGVIGATKFIYDLWGETVRVASALEKKAVPATIQVAEPTYRLLREDYMLQERGAFFVQGRGEVTTYILRGKRTPGPG